MSRKERFMTALNRGIPDRVPMFDFLFQEELYNYVLGRYPGNYNAKDAMELALKLDHDGVWVPGAVVMSCFAAAVNPCLPLDGLWLQWLVEMRTSDNGGT